MAYDEGLAERIRNLLALHGDLAEQKMFGGIAWMLSGNMACGVMGDEVIVRLSKEDREQALTEDGVREFDFTGKPLSGFVVVEPGTDEDLASWVETGVAYASSLPPKLRR